METKIDSGVVQFVADALDVSVEDLLKNEMACRYFTGLFYSSPHSGREKPAMILARLALAEKLLRTLHRNEIDEFITENPDFALDLLKSIQGDDARGDGVEVAFGTLKRRCDDAVSDGGLKRR